MLPPVMVHITHLLYNYCETNPVQSKVVDPDPLCWLEFTEDWIITSCKSGMSLSYKPQNLGVNY